MSHLAGFSHLIDVSRIVGSRLKAYHPTYLALSGWKQRYYLILTSPHYSLGKLYGFQRKTCKPCGQRSDCWRWCRIMSERTYKKLHNIRPLLFFKWRFEPSKKQLFANISLSLHFYGKTQESRIVPWKIFYWMTYSTFNLDLILAHKVVNSTPVLRRWAYLLTMDSYQGTDEEIFQYNA